MRVIVKYYSLVCLFIYLLYDYYCFLCFYKDVEAEIQMAASYMKSKFKIFTQRCHALSEVSLISSSNQGKKIKIHTFSETERKIHSCKKLCALRSIEIEGKNRCSRTFLPIKRRILDL